MDSDDGEAVEMFADCLSDIPSSDDEECNSENSERDNEMVIPSENVETVILDDSDSGESKLDEVSIAACEPGSITEAANVIFNDDLFEMFSHQVNLYNKQTSRKHKISKTLQWTSVTPSDMRKFLGLVLLMGFTQKDNWTDFWSTDPLLIVPIFSETMSRNRFNQIWTFWHFNDNEQMVHSSSRLSKVQPILEYFVNKFKTVYEPKQKLLLDENIIPWKGHCKPSRTAKHGLRVKTKCEKNTGYIYNVEICFDEKKTRAGGTKSRNLSEVQNDSHVKGITYANKNLSHYSILNASVKWARRVVLFLINCGLFNSFIVYQTLNPQSKIRYEKFLLDVIRDWISHRYQDPISTTNLSTRKVPRKDHPQRLSGNYTTQHIPVQIQGSGKKKFPTRTCRVCSANGKRSETRYICKFCSVPLHIRECFTKYHSFKKY